MTWRWILPLTLKRHHRWMPMIAHTSFTPKLRAHLTLNSRTTSKPAFSATTKASTYSKCTISTQFSGRINRLTWTGLQERAVLANSAQDLRCELHWWKKGSFITDFFAQSNFALWDSNIDCFNNKAQDGWSWIIEPMAPNSSGNPSRICSNRSQCEIESSIDSRTSTIHWIHTRYSVIDWSHFAVDFNSDHNCIDFASVSKNMLMNFIPYPMQMNASDDARKNRIRESWEAR